MMLPVGEVIAISGIKIIIRMFDDSNKETIFFDGDKYKGVSIREYLTIKRGFREIVCFVEGEFLDETKFEKDGNKIKYIRKVEVKPIGYFENNKFHEGIKFLPMIGDQANIIKEAKIAEIFGDAGSKDFAIGEMLKEGIPVSLPWQKLFNTHIAIFGNTGSGKSNTLAKLFTTLFENKLQDLQGKSKFILIDFNGEYTSQQILQSPFKDVVNLETNSANGLDKFEISERSFWNDETLSILFQATKNTQKPFIKRVISNREKYQQDPNSLQKYLEIVFKTIFLAAATKAEVLDLMRKIAEEIGHIPLQNLLKNNITFRTGGAQKLHCNNAFADNSGYMDGKEAEYDRVILPQINGAIPPNLDPFREFVIRAYIRLTSDLHYGFVQFEHIQPLLKRIDASFSSLIKVISVVASPAEVNVLRVVSLRKCNQEVKKIVPMLIAKEAYQKHRNEVQMPPQSTMHIIIDEAHNILNYQSNSEHESWKDYRLELFEEIIKEGRKFGVFLTLSSQRPADISPTIVSQIHNFFIHRLVNDRDLFLLDNTISTLDKISRALIPNLSKGSCIVTGTSFDLPMLIQVDRLSKEMQPDSEDVDLRKIWSNDIPQA